MTITNPGKNTVSGKELLQFIEDVEQIRVEKSELADQEKAVFARAKAAGFDTKTMRHVIKRRAEKPSALQEAQDMLDMYLHAVGMEAETPLFRAVGLMSVDTAAREQVIDALSQLVPEKGEIILKVGAQPVRLFRDKAGEPQVEDYVEPVLEPQPAPAGRPGKPARPKPPPPDVTQKGAFELGQKAFREDQPITSNPFPHDDKRRPKFDQGWRAASGTDGMGPDEGA